MEKISKNTGVQTTLDLLFADFEPSKNQQFLKHHKANPEVYEVFKQLALDTIKKGFKKFSARALFQVMRWMNGPNLDKMQASNISQKIRRQLNKAAALRPYGVYKFNNNHTPYYVRMFEREYPQHKDFFEKRNTKYKI
ncbi:hypothetical protein C7967_11511 [Thalassospira sp. 11-3]|nr:hypothetical protein C7967_11511 [Thalassospira sp. 11-3]